MSYNPIIKPEQQPAYEAIDSPRLLTVLINADTCGARGVLAGMSFLYQGQRSPADTHDDMEEIFYVVSGRGRVIIDHVEHKLVVGDVAYVRNGSEHQFIADDDSSLHLFWAFNAHPDAYFKEKFSKWKPVTWPIKGA